jgi:hypothetical protein
MPAYDDVEVVAVQGVTGASRGGDAPTGSVSLARAADAPDNFDAPATYSLAWEGGWGIVGPATSRPDGTVTRSLVVRHGGPPVTGQPAALNRASWLGDPAPPGFTLAKTDVMVGANPAWFFPATDGSTDTVAIIVHGQNGNRSNVMRFVEPATAAGLAVLDITYRNDLGAEADPSGRLQYGQTEWRDLDAAVTWARDRGSTDVVLIGESMGGAIVAAFLEESAQADLVSKVLLDAPMLSLGETVSWNSRDAMPVVGGAVPAPVIWAAEQITTLRFGVDWPEVDYLDDTSWLRAPTLVLHGTDDQRVPVTVARTVKAAQPELVTLVEFPDALHTEAWNWDPGRFQEVVSSFLRTG